MAKAKTAIKPKTKTLYVFVGYNYDGQLVAGCDFDPRSAKDDFLNADGGMIEQAYEIEVVDLTANRKIPVTKVKAV